MEKSSYFFIILVIGLYIVAFYLSEEKGYVNNVNRVIITVAYLLAMCATILSSSIFLCVLSVRFGAHFFKQYKKEVRNPQSI